MSGIQRLMMGIGVLVCVLVACSVAQNVEPLDDDQAASKEEAAFYTNVQADIEDEVRVAKAALLREARVAEVAAKNYATAKVKQNFFKALRVLAEKELEKVSMQDRMRQPRQAEDEEDATDDAEASTSRTVPLIPVVASVLKAVFGGNNNTGSGGLNLTYHLQSASNNINKRITGLANLLTNPFGLRTPVTARPVQIIQVLPVPVSSPVQALNATAPLDPVVTRLLRKDETKYDFDTPFIHVFVTNATEAPARTTTEEAVHEYKTPGNITTSDPNAGAGVIYIDELAKGVQQSVESLIKAMPDLFQGARETLTLFEQLQDILDGIV